MFDIDKKEDVGAIIEYVTGIGIKVIDTIPTLNGAHVIVEVFNPRLLDSLQTKQEDYILPGGESFTFRAECNTILYASTGKSL
jgi:hypothetical protein